MNRIAMLVSGLAAVAFTGVASANPNPTPSDESIITKLHFINQQEIRLGGEVATKAEHSGVKEFAAMMVADHTKGDTMLMELSKKKLSLTIGEYDPQNVAERQELIEHNAAVTKVLELKGHAFDLEYMQLMVTAHTKVIAEVEKFDPEALKPESKAFLQELLPMLRHHKEEAERVLAAEKLIH